MALPARFVFMCKTRSRKTSDEDLRRSIYTPIPNHQAITEATHHIPIERRLMPGTVSCLLAHDSDGLVIAGREEQREVGGADSEVILQLNRNVSSSRQLGITEGTYHIPIGEDCSPEQMVVDNDGSRLLAIAGGESKPSGGGADWEVLQLNRNHVSFTAAGVFHRGLRWEAPISSSESFPAIFRARPMSRKRMKKKCHNSRSERGREREEMPILRIALTFLHAWLTLSLTSYSPF